MKDFFIIKNQTLRLREMKTLTGIKTFAPSKPEKVEEDEMTE